VFPLNILALRDRRDDIKPLIAHFINKIASSIKRNIEISEDAVNILYNYIGQGT